MPAVTALDKNGVHVIFNVQRGGETVTLTMRATSDHTLTDFLFQCAVPRVTCYQPFPDSPQLSNITGLNSLLLVFLLCRGCDATLKSNFICI